MGGKIMPVSGRELASLDFANLIGGPLNAVIEAQAKSAITTASFIREVAFDGDGKVIDVNFTYNRKNDDGKDQQFTLTVPFLTMLPVPYITIVDALIEFNAKITSINESSAEDTFSQEVSASAGGGWWFVSAKVTSKTAYQKKSATAEREERTFDMHVRVEAKNQDMPAGTERLLTILENSIAERSGPPVLRFTVRSIEDAKITVDTDQPEDLDLERLKESKFKALPKGKKESAEITIKDVSKEDRTITVEPALDDSVKGGFFTIDLKEPES
jgi:hypothetical protein